MSNLQKIDECGCVETFLDSMNDCGVHICENCMGYINKFCIVGELISLSFVTVALVLIFVVLYRNRY